MGWCGICIDTATSHTKLNSWRLCKLLPSLVELVLIKFTGYIYIYIHLFLISFFFAALGVDYGSFPLATPSSRPPHTIVWHFANFVFDIALSNFPAKEIGRYKNGHCSGKHMLGPFTTSAFPGLNGPPKIWSSKNLLMQSGEGVVLAFVKFDLAVLAGTTLFSSLDKVSFCTALTSALLARSLPGCLAPN